MPKFRNVPEHQASFLVHARSMWPVGQVRSEKQLRQTMKQSMPKYSAKVGSSKTMERPLGGTTTRRFESGICPAGRGPVPKRSTAATPCSVGSEEAGRSSFPCASRRRSSPISPTSPAWGAAAQVEGGGRLSTVGLVSSFLRLQSDETLLYLSCAAS